MPKVERVEIFDDVEYQNGEGQQVEATETRDFSIGNKSYRTYLSEENAKRFDEDLGFWTEFAEQVSQGASRSTSRSSQSSGTSGSSRKPRQETSEIREWAKTQNFDPPVSGRGRIPQYVTEAYYQAHPDKDPAS